MALHIQPNSTEVALLNCEQAFEGLTPEEKRYSHHLSQACFKGGLVVLFQTSPESPGIFVLLQKLFRAQTPQDIRKLAESVGFTKDDIQALFIYAAAFYNNMGNYKSFGDSKFIPGVSKDKFETLIQASAAYKEDKDAMDVLWCSVKDRLFSLDDRQKELGLGQQGTTTYYSANCDEADAKIAQEFMNSKKISPYNTRLFKTKDLNTGAFVYEIRMASTLTTAGNVPGFDNDILGDYPFQPSGSDATIQFKVTRGDYSPLMKMVFEELDKSKVFAANDNERNMLTEYVKSFKTGSISSHKDGSRHWINNQGPIVETYIGFIESYRDPYGVRGEFEGFVAVVNKKMSAKFGKLVDSAEKLLSHLPWPAEFEKDTFLRPDFTSLDVLSFGGSGIPAGINIPNYDDIRQSEGFKNVSLGNVLTSGYKDNKITFLQEEDKELYTKYKIPSFEVQVGLHELLGHGSGKLFTEDEKENVNFDKNIPDPVSGEKISSWYMPGETWDSKFSTIASTYEECRAECVGIFLCLLKDALEVFGHTEDDADDIIYINWLNMVRAGVCALEFYSPDTSKWRQAHMNARFVILRVLLEAGHDLVKIEKTLGEDKQPDLVVKLDRAKISTIGKVAIANFLKKLQVYKSTANVEAASRMYEYYSNVNDHEAPHFLSLRSIVMARKQPRKLFVQHGTSIKGYDCVSSLFTGPTNNHKLRQLSESGCLLHKKGLNEEILFKTYDSTPDGVIQSFIDRFPSADLDTTILSLWEKEKPYY